VKVSFATANNCSEKFFCETKKIRAHESFSFAAAAAAAAAV
jgi:hypothetical protein